MSDSHWHTRVGETFPTERPTVFIGVPCGKTPVCDAFYHCFYALQAPEGSIWRRVQGGSVARNLNCLVDLAIEHECTHLFIVEDDSVFAPDTVMRLLAHEKPVVAGLCLARNPPFRPYIYSGFVPGKGLAYRPLLPNDAGLIRVAATGMGGILIRTDVFAKLHRPYFEVAYHGETEWGQDILFGKQLIDAGIDVFCDVDVKIGHVTQCEIAAVRSERGWHTVIRVDETRVDLPMSLFQEK